MGLIRWPCLFRCAITFVRINWCFCFPTLPFLHASCCSGYAGGFCINFIVCLLRIWCDHYMEFWELSVLQRLFMLVMVGIKANGRKPLEKFQLHDKHSNMVNGELHSLLVVVLVNSEVFSQQLRPLYGEMNTIIPQKRPYRSRRVPSLSDALGGEATVDDGTIGNNGNDVTTTASYIHLDGGSSVESFEQSVSFNSASCQNGHLISCAIHEEGVPANTVPLHVQSSGCSSTTRPARRRRVRRRLPAALTCQPTPSAPMMLSNPTVCVHCGARKFQYESLGSCCANGEVKVSINTPPQVLIDLFEGNDEDSKNFRMYARLYNNSFAFTSLGGDIDCGTSKGIYVFKLLGQIYHYLPRLVASDQNPKFLQLYFYDPQQELEIRSNQFAQVRASVIAKLMSVMDNNPYARFFRSLRHAPIDANTLIRISKNPLLDQRVFNAPTSFEVAGILLDSTTSSDFNGLYIVASGNDQRSHRIMHYYGCYDPLQYPLLFPHGESGWCPGIKRSKRNGNRSSASRSNPVLEVETVDELLAAEDDAAATRSRKCISCREYYWFLLQIREAMFLLLTERILQQFCVDMYVKLENSRLDFFRNNQPSIRADLYQGIIDSSGAGEDSASNIGQKVILPPSFIGGPRDMRCRYLNAMALVRRYGKPDLFITLTCNPNWPEIKKELRPGQHASSRPDLLSRIFRAKLIHLKKELVDRKIFGEVAAYVYVVEFQKRGLPHAHFLVILKPENKLRGPDDYDRFVSAELPPTNQPHLREVVINHMMHGPCGPLDLSCGCMQDVNGKKYCRFNYPKAYSEFTSTNDDGYPTYRRRNTGETVLVRKAYLDNRWVIPYNPYLLALFDCHLNVEVCSTVNAVKYLYKYIYKGHDRVAFNVASDERMNNRDEIEQFQRGRWISPPEAVWRLAGYALYEMHPPVLPLQVHLENMQSVSFNENEAISSIIADEARCRTPLTEFFRVNSQRPEGERYLYSEFPEHYSWDSSKKIWKPRIKKSLQVGRLTFVTPSEPERFHLRLLLTEVRGPTSFRDLRTVDGVVYDTFKAAAEAKGLVEQENSAEQCMDEAVTVQMPHALRRLFVMLLIFCHPSDPARLWQRYYPSLSEDFRHMYPHSEDRVFSHVCRSVRQTLENMGKSLEDFGLENLYEDETDDMRVIRDIQDVLDAPIPQQTIDARKQLNYGQKLAYKAIVRCIKDGKPGLFFIDGPGGTGKTFLYGALYAKARLLGKIVLPTASSGIAAANLPCGRTAHSRFKIPIDYEISLVCNVPKQGALAALLKETALIIWDEAPMANKANVHSLDLLLRDVTDSDLPFGGKIVVLGGDFRQVLPVVPQKSQHEAVDASLVSSFLWPQFTRFHLTENMRAREDPCFADFLLSLGDGRLQDVEVSPVVLPSELITPCLDDVDPMDAIVEHIFPELQTSQFSAQSFIDKAILAPRNDEVDQLNSSFIEKFDGDFVTYKSFDKLLDDNCSIYPVEFLHTLAPAGMSPHELILKKECPIMLTRNLDPSGGLCNGTRLICKQFLQNLIVCEIATGSHKGQQAMIPRVYLRPPPSLKLPFQFQRTQFPIKLSFAMTINKSQGQTLNNVGVYLQQHCFSHGQLYVALSRARRASNVKVLLHVNEPDYPHNSVRNVVSYEVLRRAGIVV